MQNITKEKYTGFIERGIAWNIRDLFKEIISFIKKEIIMNSFILIEKFTNMP